MKYKLYTTSKKAWRAMMEEIKKAKKSIYIEMYIFVDDTDAPYDFIKILKEKAQNGLDVVVVADSFGSSELKSSTIQELKNSGVEVLFFSKWLRITHRKILIIDEKTVFLGGVNIEKNSMDWLDLQIKIVGPRLAKNILRSFAYTYEMSGGKNEYIASKRRKNILKTIKAQFLEHWPNHKIFALQAYYQEKIISAQKKIIIVTPYFTPPRWLMALLENAVVRGVEVDIFIPRDTDIKILNRVNRAYVKKMSGLKINFYSQNKMNHAKVLIVDDEEALIGSQNLDLLSFNRSIESGVFIKDKKLLEQLHTVIDTWRNNSVKFSGKLKSLNILEKFFLWIIKIFYSIL